MVSAQGAGGSGKRSSGGFHGDFLSLRLKSRFTPTAKSASTAKTASATKSTSSTKTASALPTSQGQPTLSTSTKTLFSLTTMMWYVTSEHDFLLR
ncbi:hypothetical protein [Desulfobulbus propionicus]|jgi:hypothetical protein